MTRRSLSPRALVTFFGIASAVLAVGCNPIHEIDMAVDCSDLCHRYADCYDSSYDVAGCENRCHEMVDRDPDVANQCDACLDARTCTEAFGCADECYSLIP